MPMQNDDHLAGQIIKQHHVAIIASEKVRSLQFYVDILGFEVVEEIKRANGTIKIDLNKNGVGSIELFIYSSPPDRLTYPEAAGLRHLAFEVKDIDVAVDECKKHGLTVEAIRHDPIDGKKFTFIFDPDNLPIELCERV